MSLGDGRADFHWADKFTGDVTVFYNDGEAPNSGSSFTWNDAGEVWRGSALKDTGTNFHFPNLNGLGRADLHDVNPRVNSVRVLQHQPPTPIRLPALTRDILHIFRLVLGSISVQVQHTQGRATILAAVPTQGCLSTFPPTLAIPK
jgi:hypothetical protein